MRQAASVLVLALFGGCGAVLAQEKPPAPGLRQEAPPAPVRLGPLDASVTWRNRVELWSWFDTGAADGDYAYVNSLVRAGLGQTRPSFAWKLEVSQPSFLGVPDDAMAPPPQGA